jgi:hypothetical protein
MWEYGDNEIEISYANKRFLKIGTGGVMHVSVRVEKSDFDRIKKELEDYMGL